MFRPQSPYQVGMWVGSLNGRCRTRAKARVSVAGWWHLEEGNRCPGGESPKAEGCPGIDRGVGLR